MNAPPPGTDRPMIGWREWAGLPDLGVPWIKAKIDTGARSSSLHAFGLETFERDDQQWVRFEIHPWQRSAEDAVGAEAPVVDERTVRSSNGVSELRPVIRTALRLGELVVPTELTLARRDDMGFRLLVGRQTMRGRVLIDPERSFIGGRPPVEVRRANRKWRRG